MKKILSAILFFTIIFSYTSNLYAKKYNIVFWYPGEQGTTAEAEPVLDSFFEYLNKNVSGNTFTGKYFNSKTKGLAYINKSKPKFGIISWVALKENDGSIPAHGKIATTLPYPDGTATDKFVLVGNPGDGEWSPPANLTIISSIPMSVNFLKSYLLPDLGGNVSIQTTNTMLMTLKKIATGGEDSGQVALLTPMEKFTLDNLKSGWTETLKTLKECKPISTAPFIYFGEKPEVSDELVKTLTSMKNDPDGKEILETLRLKGFKAD